MHIKEPDITCLVKENGTKFINNTYYKCSILDTICSFAHTHEQSTWYLSYTLAKLLISNKD